MEQLIAIDIAILPPPETTARAIALSASLSEDESQGLRLDADHPPHVTLMQLFARRNEIDAVIAKVDEAVRHHSAVPLRVTGGGQGAHSVWMAIERTPPVVALYERLMDTLRELEREGGGTGAFLDEDARVRDVLWVAGYRLESSLGHYTPHITLGHGSAPPAVEPFSFEATTVAVCHLGKFCTCREVLRQWQLPPELGRAGVSGRRHL